MKWVVCAANAADTIPRGRICHLEAERLLARLNPKSNINIPRSLKTMTFPAGGAPLRSLRIRSGLSQKEIADLLGFRTDSAAFRHECGKTIPDLRAAMGYEVVFRVPISLQFPALYRSVEPVIQDRILRLKELLQEQPGKGPNAARDARKLEFLWERENVDLD